MSNGFPSGSCEKGRDSCDPGAIGARKGGDRHGNQHREMFNGESGLGFITQGDGDPDLGHFSAITGSGYRNLEEGQKVQHEASQGSRGLQATGGRSPGASCSDAAGSNPR